MKGVVGRLVRQRVDHDLRPAGESQNQHERRPMMTTGFCKNRRFFAGASGFSFNAFDSAERVLRSRWRGHCRFF